MAFLAGPRQVGKTTTVKAVGEAWGESHYWSWDLPQDRERLLGGPERIMEAARLHVPRDRPPLLIFDELHKFAKWKDLLKGLFDAVEDRARILVTGSARLDIFRYGGDSLMGRYFPYRMHPLSAGELAAPEPREELLRPAGAVLHDDDWLALREHGGFPEPFLRRDRRFTTLWRRTRRSQLFREDLRDLTRIRDLGQVEHLGELLRRRAGQLCSYASLAREVQASIDTVKSWLRTLDSFYYCFAVRPWFRNVPRALRKEPKYYLWDWAQVPDEGQRAENFVAAALMKSVQVWTDLGLGDFGLHFIRDKDGKEVDFLVSRDGEPWMLFEVKAGSPAGLSKPLAAFHRTLGTEHALQLLIDHPHAAVEPFRGREPAAAAAAAVMRCLP
ncbi:MAG: ATP-binding protein [Planctomycetes bacterium]|nr:ATP-binding protein [Planctomycetota bacterium]MBL7008321.1 ATP-binding protein [Planctomycetota bacterium]